MRTLLHAFSSVRYADPLLPLIIILAIGGLIRTWRRTNERPWLLLFSTAGLILISSPILAVLLSKPLERRYARRHWRDTGEGIVVLGGACQPPDVNHPIAPLGADTYARSFYAAELYARGTHRPMIVTGRNCADSMALVLQVQGVSREDIFEEDRANNTHENAAYSSLMLRALSIRRITLVTDAKSMLRAELSFGKEGFEVVPYPVGLGTPNEGIPEFVPTWQAIRANGDTIHEIVGLLWYRVKGWI